MYKPFIFGISLLLVLGSCGNKGTEQSAVSEEATNTTTDQPSSGYTLEVLKNPTFDSGEGWVMANPAVFRINEKSMVVNNKDIATQPVPVVSGEKYVVEASVRAIKPGSLFRLQVNWLDDKSNMVSADIEPIEAGSDFKTYTKYVIVPAGAKVAVVYACGHDVGDEVEYTSLSFRK